MCKNEWRQIKVKAEGICFVLVYVINTCTVYIWFNNLISLGKINNIGVKILWSVRGYI